MHAIDSRWARNEAEAVLEVVDRGRWALLSSTPGWHGRRLMMGSITSTASPQSRGLFCRMNYNRRQLDEIARQLIRDGYFFYRHDFVWGFTPAFRNAKGTHFYFIVKDQILTPRQMYTHLVKTWCPSTPDEQMFFQNRLTAHFAALPGSVPTWHGLTPVEMLSAEVFQGQNAMEGHHEGAYAV